MITLVCSIMITIHSDCYGGTFERKAVVEGKLISQSDFKYLVDFSKGVKKFNVDGPASDYEEVIVDKNDCVKK